MFIDSDDYISKDCIYKMYQQAKKEDLDILVSDYYEDHSGTLKKVDISDFEISNLRTNPSLINKINLGPCNKIYKRSLINNNHICFEEKLKYEDAPFVCLAFCVAQKIGKINDYLSYYVIHEKSETTSRNEKIFDIIKIVDKIVKTMDSYDYLDEPKINLAVMILTDYTIQTRYMYQKQIRNKFINEAFDYLYQLDNNWKKSQYLKKFPLLKRFVKTNKILTKVYCTLYPKN